MCSGEERSGMATGSGGSQEISRILIEAAAHAGESDR
jgi:hypothetical protein